MLMLMLMLMLMPRRQCQEASPPWIRAAANAAWCAPIYTAAKSWPPWCCRQKPPWRTSLQGLVDFELIEEGGTTLAARRR